MWEVEERSRKGEYTPSPCLDVSKIESGERGP